MLGDKIIAFFSGFGDAGMLIALFVIFLTDAMLFPALPEFFLLAIYSVHPSVSWGLLLIALSALSIFLGNSILYLIVKKAGMPEFIERLMGKYSSMMVFQDERMLLINRIAPVLPYTGAFIAVNRWDYKKSIFYIVAGGLVKYSLLVALSASFYSLFKKGVAQQATFLLIIMTIVAGFILSYVRKRKIYGEGKES